MGKIEGIIKSEIVRLARREIRKISVPLGRDVWFLKSAVSDKVILGSLFVRGENITLREAGDSGIPKIDVGHLETGKTSLTY